MCGLASIKSPVQSYRIFFLLQRSQCQNHTRVYRALSPAYWWLLCCSCCSLCFSNTSSNLVTSSEAEFSNAWDGPLKLSFGVAILFEKMTYQRQSVVSLQNCRHSISLFTVSEPTKLLSTHMPWAPQSKRKSTERNSLLGTQIPPGGRGMGDMALRQLVPDNSSPLVTPHSGVREGLPPG